MQEPLKSLISQLDGKRVMPAIFSSKVKDGLSTLSKQTMGLCINAVTPDYQLLTINHTAELVEEYNCQTPSEKMLAHIAATALARHLDYSEELRSCRAIEWHSSQHNGYYSMISKESDRACRQYLSLIMSLQQIKKPAMEVNVTAKTAFIAENQQFNNNNNVYENIRPK
jgi:hypothetical protein